MALSAIPKVARILAQSLKWSEIYRPIFHSLRAHMKKVAIGCVLVVGMFAASACDKKEMGVAETSVGELVPATASPNDNSATVTMADGSRYHGALISKV